MGIWDAVNAEDFKSLKQLVCNKQMGLVKNQDGRTPLHLAYKWGFDFMKLIWSLVELDWSFSRLVKVDA